MKVNRTNKTQSGTGVSPVRSEAYTYDAIDQITSVAYATNAIPMRNVSYQYDAVGNRSQMTEDGNPIGYTANSLNQYTVVDGSSLSYDNNGNLSSTMIGLLGSWTYTYDAQNRLVSAFGGPSSVTATFAYDARNRCVSRTVNGVATYLLWDGWSLLEERNASGGLLAEYIHGATIDEILQSTTGSGAVYYHHDGLGSTIAVTDNTGALAESYVYDVFGTPSFFDANGVGLPSSVVGNRFLFTGREFLADIGLYDYRNRFYSPLLGRFLQTDPIEFEAKDRNLYSFCFNNPITQNDPDGLDVVLLNRPRSAGTFGHNGILVGSDTERWRYYSKEGSKAPNEARTYNTFSEFQRSDVARTYTDAYRVPATPEQDARMKAYGDRNYNRAFSVAQERDPKTGAILSENCADLTGEILAAGSFDVVNTKATGRTIPNEQYREFQNTYARQGYTVVPAAKRAKP